MFAPSRQLLTIRCVTTAGSRGCEPGDRLSDEGWSLSGAGALGEDGGDWYTGQSRQVLEVADLCGARTGRPGSDDQSARLDAVGQHCVHGELGVIEGSQPGADTEVILCTALIGQVQPMSAPEENGRRSGRQRVRRNV